MEYFRVAPLAKTRPGCGFEMLDPSSSDLVRLNVQTSTDDEKPRRQRFTTTLEADDCWHSSLYLYVLRRIASEHSVTYVVETSGDRSRLRPKDRDTPQVRDISEWTPLFEVFAFPERMPGTVECSVDWTSAPDRYTVSLTDNAKLCETGWLRCFRFFAYSASKIHFMEQIWSEDAKCFRVCVGHQCPIEDDWRCLFAFFAFDTPLPNTNRYTIQSSDCQGYKRIRIGMTPSSRRDEWKDEHVFYAHDVPIPGSSRFNVQYRVRDGYTTEWEQNKISIDEQGGGNWLEKFAFYAFPASTLDIADHYTQYALDSDQA